MSLKDRLQYVTECMDLAEAKKEMTDEWRETFEDEAARRGMVRLTPRNIRVGQYTGSIGTDWQGKLDSTNPTSSWTVFSFTGKTFTYGSTSGVDAGPRFHGRRYRGTWDGWGYRVSGSREAPTPSYAYIAKG